MRRRALLAAALATFAAGGAAAGVAADLVALTGQRTRMVWIEGTGGQGHPFGPIHSWGVTNGFATIKLYRLVVFDTEEGAERILQSEVDAYLMPMITPNGGRVIWTDTGQAQPEVWICDWDGSNKRKLLDAWQALGVSKDANGIEWVYVGEGTNTNGYQYCRRYQIDNTAVSELVWDKTPTNDMWSVTPDGTIAGMGFQDDRWTGPAALPNGTYTYAGQGCNCCICPDGTKYWHMEPDHKGIFVYDVAPNLSVSGRRYIDMHNAPGMGGGDMDMIWYAKWSEFDPLVFTLSGSHPSLGLQQSYGDIYVGKLNAACTAVTAWVRVTSTSDKLETLPRIWTGTPETLPDTPPDITSVPPTVAFANLAYSYEISVAGRPAPAVTVSGLPAWLSFAGRTISGTPGPADVGTTGTITVTATSSAGTDTQSFQIEVRAVENGLVGHWTFDSPEEPWLDSSGLGNHGSPAGGSSWSASGRIGGAASFTGTSCVVVPDSPSLSMTGDMTAAAWFSFSSSGVHAANILSKDYNSGWRFRAAFNPGTNFYGLECLIQAEGGWVTMPAGFALNTWYHVAVVFDSSSGKKLFYVDGSLLGESQGTKPALPDTAGPLVIGAGTADGTEGWFGLLDDVRLYSRALGASEIAALASGQGLEPPAITSTAPTIANVGSLYTYQIVATGSPTPTIGVSGAPAWLTLSGNVLSGTPTAAGTTGQITVTATNAAGSAQQSFAITVVQPPSIAILRPGAGEVWYVGTTHRISWTTTNLNNIVISYSTDGGTTWQQIEGAGSIFWNDPHWGSFPWQVPDEPSTNCIVNIRGYKFEASVNSPAFEIRTVIDSDGDGMDDGWEAETFGDMSHDETTDADGDGHSDLDEFRNGTDPTDPADPSPPEPGESGFSCVPRGGGDRRLVLAAVLVLPIAALVARRRPRRSRPVRAERATAIARRALAAGALLAAGATVPARGALADVASDILALTGGQRTKIVWMRDMVPGQGDLVQELSVYRLMVFDTNEGVERELAPGPASYYHPLITPSGQQVLYFDYDTNKVRIINWDGTGHRDFCDGYLYDVYRDSSGVDWVVVNDFIHVWNRPALPYPVRIRRVRLDNPAVEEVILTHPDQKGETFDISSDGLVGGGLQVHPTVGVYDMTTGAFSQRGSYACNTDLAPDTSYMFWHMQGGGHTNIVLYPNYPSTSSRTIWLNGAPNIDGDESWNPRWTNNVRFMTMTGPIEWDAQPPCWNIYIGRFDQGFTQVEAWVQVTDTPNMDANANGWIEPAGPSPPVITSTPPGAAYVGFLYSYTVSALGNPAPSFSISGNPPWLGLSGNVVSGIPPAAGTTGVITITAQNASGTATQTFQIEVTEGDGTLVGHWTFDDQSAPGRDESIYRNDGTMTGDATRTAAGKLGGALQLGGAGRLVVPDSPSLSVTGDMTVAAWFRLDAVETGVFNILGKDFNSSFRLRLGSNAGWFGLELLTNPGSGVLGGWYTHSPGFAPGIWYHVAATFTAATGEKRFYVDGQYAGTGPTPAPGGIADTAGALAVGAGDAGGLEPWKGRLDDVRLYSRALTAQEIEALAAAGAGGSAPDITSVAPTFATVGVPYSYTIVATGDPPPTFTATGLPAWLALSGDTLSGTPTAPGQTGTITITATNSAGSDTQSFSIAVAPARSITVTSPAAGDVWYVGTTRSIVWSTSNVHDVVIVYSVDAGASWLAIPGAETIITSGSTWHSFRWTVPDTPSASCVVRVFEYFLAAEDSSEVFEIRAVTDSDGDGMDDGWEAETFGDMSHDETTDADGDGLTDYEEFMGGTDPLSAEGRGGFSCAARAGRPRAEVAAALWVAAIFAALRRRARAKEVHG